MVVMGALLGSGGGFFLFICEKKISKKVIRKLSNCKKLILVLKIYVETCFLN